MRQRECDYRLPDIVLVDLELLDLYVRQKLTTPIADDDGRGDEVHPNANPVALAGWVLSLRE
jgi:hypothetical protein